MMCQSGRISKQIQVLCDALLLHPVLEQYCPFERVYLQKASSAITSNCGPGSFGLLFMRRTDAAVPFFDTPGQERA